MAMKENIRIRRDMELKFVHESKNLSQDDKVNLTGLITEAAECTNGLTEKEKVQHLSETTFGVTTMLARIAEQLSANNSLTNSLSTKLDSLQRGTQEKFDSLQKSTQEEFDRIHETILAVSKSSRRDIRDLDWKDTLKLALVKPWIWLFLSAACFSPKGVELIQFLFSKLP